MYLFLALGPDGENLDKYNVVVLNPTSPPRLRPAYIFRNVELVVADTVKDFAKAGLKLLERCTQQIEIFANIASQQQHVLK